MKTLFLSIILFSLVSFTTQACTDPTKPFLPSGSTVCEACPSSTPLWDPYGLQCVASCPAIAPKYDSNLWCQTCPSTTPYWDTTTLTCATCPSGYYNPYTLGCQTSCPTYAPNWNSTNKPGSCVRCTTGSPYWFDNSTNISAANTQPLAKCMEQCEFPWPYADANKYCEACPANIQYWDETLGQCLASCPNARPDPGTNNYCSACPVLSPRWNSVSQACEPCPTATPYFDNTTFTCVARCADSTAATPSYDTDSWCQNCSITSYVYYWDDANSVCAGICPRPNPTNDSVSWCKTCSYIDATKPKWNSQSNLCTDVCPTNMPSTDSDNYCVACAIATPMWSTTNSMCEACPTGTHYDSQTSQTAPYGSCLDPCPVTRPFVNPDNWCVSCSGTDSWDSYVSIACVTPCPRSAPATDSNNWCQPCPAGSIYWDSTTSTCVPICPDARPVVGADNWCEACALASHWDPATTQCVASCPSTTPLVNSDNVCVACTGSTPIWNPLIPTCVSSCQGAAHFPSGGICQSCPVNNPNWDTTTSTCVTICPAARPSVDSNHRCQPCTGGAHWNPLTSTCVATCPQTNPVVDSNNWCQPCPSATPKWNSLTSTCVAGCPPAKPITGAYNWCQACPAGSPYWNPTISACVPSCQPPLPVVGANNWCEACPSSTPYWYAGTPACVATCPRNAPAVDGNNQCQSCPSAAPYWDSVTTNCYNICPAPRPVIGADAWCEECPSATPYYNGLTNVCVNTCPPQTPNVNSDNWCQVCTGALLKWDPLISSCVASCPKELPFFNKNSVPPACEVGPPVQSIVDYLQTSGVVMPATLAGMQLAMPGLPYVAVTILLIGLLKYVRYININFPEKIAKVFQEGTLNVPSLNFGPMFPEDWKPNTYNHPAPFRFAQYDINGLFVANFWRGISTALIITAGVALLQLILKKKVKNEKVVQVREKAKNFLLWNYVFSFYISNIGNLAMFTFIEYQSLYLQDSLGTGSFLVNMIFSQLSVFGLIYMVRRIKRFHKLKTQAVKKEQKLQMDESIKVLLEKFKDEHLMQMLVIPILCTRAALDAIVIAAVNNPVVQCSLLVAMNFIMIAYYIKYRPHRAIVDNIQLTAFEVTLLVVNLTCLHLGTLSSEEQIASEGAGSLLVACNVIMFVLSFLFVFTKVILAIIKAIFDKFRLKRPSNSVYVQTDISSTVEMTPTSAKYAKLETQAEDFSPEAKNSRLPSIKFGSISMDVGTEGEQSPSPAAVSRNFNSNNIRRPFHVVRIPEGEEESMHLSKYVDKRS